jgi:hypothetical protein
MSGPHTETLILIEETCRHIAHGVLAIEELAKRYDRTCAALSKAQTIISASKELLEPPLSAQIDRREPSVILNSAETVSR